MNDYATYEKACKAIKKDNAKLLKEFGAWLKSAGLSERTSASHHSNIEFYLNEYLLYEDVVEAKDGVDQVNSFLGYWFIKKAMWASEASIKGNAASLKKFYTFMHEQGLVDKQSLLELKQTIKDGLPEWLATLNRYDDPDEDDVW
jgi:site-specific recombinase XerD